MNLRLLLVVPTAITVISALFLAAELDYIPMTSTPATSNTAPILIAEPDHTQVLLTATSHDPGCTTIFMLGRDNVTFQTQIRPLPFNNYAIGELKNGVDVTFAMSARQADILLPELSVRDEISYVASYLITKPLTLVASSTNPHAHIPSVYEDLRCSSGLSFTLYKALHAIAVQVSSPSGDSGSASIENPVVKYVYIDIRSAAEPLAFLKAHGITPHTVYEPDPDSLKLGIIIADIPLLLLDELNSLEQVSRIYPAPQLQPAN